MIALRPVRLVGFNLGTSVRPVEVRLAEGPVAQPSLSSAGMKETLDSTIQALSTQIESLIVELDAASPSAIRVEPERLLEISEIGRIPADQIRLAIQTAARTLSSRIERIQGGVLSSYLSQDQVSSLSSLRSRADSVAAAVQDWGRITPENQDAVDRYLSLKVSEPDQSIRSAEEAVVSGEAGAVPVLEPFEKESSATNIAIGVGLAALTGLVLWGLLA